MFRARSPSPLFLLKFVWYTIGDNLTVTSPFAVRFEDVTCQSEVCETDVDFLHYQVLPMLVLLGLNVGLMGTALLCAREVEGGMARMPASLAGLFSCSLMRFDTHYRATHSALAGVDSAFCRHCALRFRPGSHLGTVLRGTRIIALASSLVATYLFFPAWIRDINVLIRYAINGMRQALFYPDLTRLPLDIAVRTVMALEAVLIGSVAVRHSWSV